MMMWISLALRVIGVSTALQTDKRQQTDKLLILTTNQQAQQQYSPEEQTFFRGKIIGEMNGCGLNLLA